ncbi:MAG: DUF4124 domain-containing protein [Betaproteobacteria bacterium]|nr:DUF4124 domain-containing protein [Betaproteobacteria bacterium]
MPRLLLCLVVALACSPAVADVCRWTDGDGNVHYGSHAPGGVSCDRTIHVSSLAAARPATAVARGPDYATLENEFQRRRLARLEAEVREKEQKLLRERRAEACVQATGRYNWLKAGGRAMQAGLDGERHYLDDGERSSEIAVAREKVAYYCR